MAETPQIPPAFKTVDEWMSQWLAITIDRRIGDSATPGACWCEQWWDHPEAQVRFTGLWKAWEAARASGQMDAWWRNQFEPGWRTLTDGNGPFRDCYPGVNGRTARHRQPKRPSLPVQPMPRRVAAALPDAPKTPRPAATTPTVRPAAEPQRIHSGTPGAIAR
jgi:hypothetical protein